MSKFVEVEIDGQTIKFETDQEGLSGEKAVSNLQQKIKNLLPELNATIQGISSLVSKSIASLHQKPSETTVEFGINVKAEVGAVVATSSTEAQIKVSLKWVNDGKS
jgi:hypothetical protein